MLVLERAFEIVAGGGQARAGAWDRVLPPRPAERGERVRFSGVDSARAFVRVAIARRALSVAEIRRILDRHGVWAVARMSDDLVLDTLAQRLITGEARLFSAPVRRRVPSLGVEEAEAPALGPEVEESVSVWDDAEYEALEVRPAAEAELLPEPLVARADADEVWQAREAPEMGSAEEQAQALREAAQTGKPFCEECEAARRALEAKARAKETEPEESEAEEIDAEAQAAAMKEAAASGTPLCEECEKAKAKAKADAARAEAANDPPEPEIAKLDAARQASTMKTAAATGEPFCAECERLKKAKAAKAAAAAPPPAAGAAEEPASAAEDGSMSAVDAPAQAATVKSAAATGEPFCEECEKLKKAKAAEAAGSKPN